jgi:hypothetical protein
MCLLLLLLLSHLCCILHFHRWHMAAQGCGQRQCLPLVQCAASTQVYCTDVSAAAAAAAAAVTPVLHLSPVTDGTWRPKGAASGSACPWFSVLHALMCIVLMCLLLLRCCCHTCAAFFTCHRWHMAAQGCGQRQCLPLVQCAAPTHV